MKPWIALTTGKSAWAVLRELSSNSSGGTYKKKIAIQTRGDKEITGK